MAMLPMMLEHDRRRAGWSVGQAAWRLGVSIREYRELEAGARSPTFEKWDRSASCTARLRLPLASVNDHRLALVIAVTVGDFFFDTVSLCRKS
jgi:hypothetical protein